MQRKSKIRAEHYCHMGRFLRQLRGHGFQPRVVVTDGSSLYPTLLAALWPDAEHQLCVFHLLQDINRDVLDGVKRLRRELSRRGRRGRRRRKHKANRRRHVTVQEKAHFVFKHRYLIVKRAADLGARELRDVQTLYEYLPGLRVLRQFVDQVHKLLEPAQTTTQAWARFAAWQQDARSQAVPELVKVLESFSAAKFAKAMTFLRSPLGQRVRTNNHVERMNRRLRHYEKVRYKWRTGRGIVRFMVLAVNRLWQQRQASAAPRLFSPGGAAQTAQEAARQPNQDRGREAGPAKAIA